MEINERRRKILEAIIKEYILTAEPVGSRTLSNRYKFGISSATIRNEMADLEDMGYLMQPHTSAGRIPSDKGYRFYVDSLIDIQDVPKSMERLIVKKYLTRQKEVKEIIQLTSQVLSTLTKYTAMVTSPQMKKLKLQRIQLIPLEEKRMLLLIVVGDGIVCQRIVNLTGSPDYDDLEEISRFLNSRLHGLTLAEVTPQYFQDIEKDLYKNIDFYRQLQGEINLIILEEVQQEGNKVYLEGAVNILEQPEFSDLEKAKLFFKLLEQEDVLQNLMASVPHNGLRVIIGNENPVSEMKDCSLVIANYLYKEQSFGKIAILGPTRMEYTKVISMVNFMSQLLTKVLHEED